MTNKHSSVNLILVGTSLLIQLLAGFWIMKFRTVLKLLNRSLVLSMECG
jgi:hypothetical protein